MKYLIGIDGGGSKTKLECYDMSGKLVSQIRTGSTDYHTVGTTNVIEILKGALGELGVDLSESLVSFGMPAYGENRAEDEDTVGKIRAAFPSVSVCIENDVVCAWAGATALNDGITIVCGTGSMAVGRDFTGKIARSGGWMPLFSDEGSGYWIGLRALELFSKQSDGRLAKGPLYGLMRKHLGIIDDDFEAFHIIGSEYANSRVKIASLQMVMLDALKQGDIEAAKIYERAIKELVLIVGGVLSKLDFGSDVIDISYIGGLFDQKELFLNPFTEEIKKRFNANVLPPKLSPCAGAILLALEKSDGQPLGHMKSKFLKINS